MFFVSLKFTGVYISFNSSLNNAKIYTINIFFKISAIIRKISYVEEVCIIKHRDFGFSPNGKLLVFDHSGITCVYRTGL